MSYVTGFEFDIFISYCHVDNLSADGKGWIDWFHKSLEIELWQKEGRRQIKIWRDLELDGSQKFERTLQSKLEKSAILLCLHSPGYRGSEYCEKELDWFRGEHGNLLEIGDRSRIFNVLLFNIPFAEWPAAFQGKSGFPFYRAEHPGSRGYPLAVKGTDFTDRLHDLTDSLYAALSAMQHGGVKPPGSELVSADRPRPEAHKGRLFFAKVSDSLATRKRRVVADLIDEGFEVIEAVPPPFENPAHDVTVEKRIQEADLSIHLLDEFPGERIQGEAKGYIQRQAEIGKQTRTSQIIWVPKELAIKEDPDPNDDEDEAYSSFLREVGTATRGRADYDFISGARSEITQEIRERIQRRKAPAQPTQQTAVLLDVHYKDQPYVTDVYKYLAAKGIQPLLNPEVDDPRASESLFVEQLKRVSALIVFFGYVAPEWVVERLFTAAKIKTLTRCPVKAFGIYMAPPQKMDGGLPEDWSPWKVHPMDNTNGFDPESLAPLLADLGTVRVGAARA